MRKIFWATLTVSVSLASCATSSKDVVTNYISPIQFQSYDCDQLQIEAARIQSRVSQLGGRLDEAASNDKTITGVGVILFWPVLFALGGTKQQEAEYARLKGEYEAIQQTVNIKKCFSANYKDKNNQNLPTSNMTRTQNAGTNSATKSSEEKLIELKRLFDFGLVSKEIYLRQQAAIFGD